MAEKIMYIPYGVTENYNFRKLQLVVETFGTKLKEQDNSIKIDKSPQANKKTLLYNFGN